MRKDYYFTFKITGPGGLPVVTFSKRPYFGHAHDGKLVVVWLSRHAALLPNKGEALRDETITATKETPMVVSSPGAGGPPDFK